MTSPLLSKTSVRISVPAGPVPAMTRRRTADAPLMTLDEAVVHFLADAPPMTSTRWAQLRPLLDAQAIGQASGSVVSLHTIDSRV